MFNSTVWMSPKINKDNKYNELLSSSIENEGITVKEFSKEIIFRIKSNDVVHFHWIAPFYQANNLILMSLKTIRFFLLIEYLKIKGVKIVWTVHNVFPHEYVWKNFERIIRKVFMKKCNKLFVASASIKNALIKEFEINPNLIEVVFHGHYKNVYPVHNINYRSKYNIPRNKIVFLFVGAIREYKNVPKLLETYLRANNSNTHLIIAGKVFEDMKETAKKFPQRKDITYDLRFIPDNELADIINSCNYVVLPYKDITTSGTAILSVSLRKRIIVPNTPFMSEYFSDDVSIKYDEDNPDELFDILKRCSLVKDEHGISDEAYASFLRRLDWEKIGNKIINIYSTL